MQRIMSAANEPDLLRDIKQAKLEADCYTLDDMEAGANDPAAHCRLR